MVNAIVGGESFTVVFRGGELVGVGVTLVSEDSFRRPDDFMVHSYYGEWTPEVTVALSRLLNHEGGGVPGGGIAPNVYYGEGLSFSHGVVGQYSVKRGHNPERSWAADFLKRLVPPSADSGGFDTQVSKMEAGLMAGRAPFLLVFLGNDLVGVAVRVRGEGPTGGYVYYYAGHSGHWPTQVDAKLRLALTAADDFFAGEIVAIECVEQGWGAGYSARPREDRDIGRAVVFLARQSVELAGLFDLCQLMTTTVTMSRPTCVLVFHGARFIGLGVTLADGAHYYVGEWGQDVSEALYAALSSADAFPAGGIVANEPYRGGIR
jgi:hypothetical protein